jgi:uncharacterized protein YbaP (TraB family)
MYFEFVGTNVRLLGSVHRLPSGQNVLPQWVLAAYQWCDVLYLERESASLRSLMLRTDGKTLRDEISAELWDALQSSWPVPTRPLRSLKPWGAVLTLATALQPAAQGVETHFLRWATGTEPRSIHHLESNEESVAFLEAVPLSDIEDCLKLLLFDSERIRLANDNLCRVWLTGDRNQLAAIATTLPITSIPRLRRALIEERNRAWIPTIAALLGTPRKTLVCVGTLHLCGPNNLIDLVGREVLPVAI